jgi:superfamily II DNA or RNA helicase
MFVEHHQVPVLILVEEIRQFGYISPHLKYSHEFAHGPLNAAQKKELAPAYWSSEPLDQVKRFDARAFPILVGTSCVSIGVDFQHVGAIFYLRGGSSEVNVRQAIGRGTRKPPGKEAFYFFDVRVDHPALKKMSQKRDKIYKECMR